MVTKARSPVAAFRKVLLTVLVLVVAAIAGLFLFGKAGGPKKEKPAAEKAAPGAKGMTLIGGRDIRPGEMDVAIVNETFVRQFFEGQNPLGKLFKGPSRYTVVRIVKDLDADLTGRDVIIVEDIVDSGLTLSYLRRNLAARGPASLEVCALLVKRGLQRVEPDLRYIGFPVPPDFVIGYGLDVDERYRNLPFICVYEGSREH